MNGIDPLHHLSKGWVQYVWLIKNHTYVIVNCLATLEHFFNLLDDTVIRKESERRFEERGKTTQ